MSTGVAPTVRAPGERPAHFFPLTTFALALATFVLYAFVQWWPRGGGPWGPGASAAIAWAFFAAHFVICRRYANAFDPIIWIPVLMLLFYMGVPIAVELFGSESTDYDVWNLRRVPPQLNRAYALASLSIVAFLLGLYSGGLRDVSHTRLSVPVDRSSVIGPVMALMLGGAFMMLMGIAIVGPGILFADYGTMKSYERFGAADFRFLGTGQLFTQAGIFGVLACHDPRRPGATRLALGVAVSLAMMLLALGDRGGLSALIFGSGFVYALRVRRVPWWIVVGGFVTAFLAVPLIGEYRALRQIQGADLGIFNLAANTFEEMGGTILVYCYTMDRVPLAQGYAWGTTFLVQALANIPNLGLEPTGWWFSFDPLQYHPSAWLTSTVSPVKFEMGGGYGYAYPAELYYNFGIPGVLLGMVATGAVTSWVRNRATASAFWLTFLALYISMMALLVRNSVGFPMRTMLWPLIGLVLLRRFWPRTRYTRPVASSPVAPVEHLSRR